MKRKNLFIVIELTISLILLIVSSCSMHDESLTNINQIPNDNYLGQTPPGTTPKIFSQNIISIDNGKEYNITFSPDLNQIVFTRRTPNGENDRLWYSYLEEEILTIPQRIQFGFDCFETDACFTPEGKRIYFNSKRPIPGTISLSPIPNVWFVDKTNNGWSEPTFLGSPLNDYHPVYYSFTSDSTMYFGTLFPREIYSVKMQNGNFTNIVCLPDAINSLRDVAHPAIAPDESYIIIDSYYEENNQIVGSMFISFKKDDGSWSQAISLKDALGASDTDIYAMASVTPDGKYIFFEKYYPTSDKSDLYWISATIIEDLKPIDKK